ncbi:MAG TPA: ABC transporter permease [Bryobacteraceae bacterium]|jgi:predicted permease|nr:ABC transporter permease [Bryobacteraceae bacterium]
MPSLRQDGTHALRRIRQSPGIAAAAIISIGLGIAANSTIFSMVSRFVLQSPRVGDPGTLLALHTTQFGDDSNEFTWPLFSDIREQAKSFSGIAAYYDLIPASIGGKGEPERIWGQAATTNFFDVTRLGMSVGRGFLQSEDRLPVVVLGYDLWQRRFGGDRNIAGRRVILSGRPFTVVGVAPRSFRSLDQILYTQFWVPLGELDQLLPNTANYVSRDYNWLNVVARLKPGTTREQAAAELKVLGRRAAHAYPVAEKNRGFRFEQAGSLPPRERPIVTLFLVVLTAVVLLVLSIACMNVANLLLAQSASRQREMAVRLAIGATRGQLMGQILTESVLLALGGGVLGVVLSLWATSALSSMRLPAPVPLDVAVTVDWRVLLYTFALSVSAGLLFGVVPAWAASRPLLANALKGEDALARVGRRWTLRNVLTVSQVAMSLVLLCGTGLFLRSLQAAVGMNIGFRSQGVLMMSVDPRLHGYTPQRVVQFLSNARQAAAAVPGVRSAACTDGVPLSGGNRSDGFHVEGRPAAPQAPIVDLYMATRGYFETLGIPLLSGREFENENATGPKVAVVNEALAQRMFPHENPIGQHISGGGFTYQIIGVVKNIKSRTLGENVRPVLFRSLAQSIASDPSLMGYSILVYTSGDPGRLAGALRNTIHTLDPTLAIFNAETMKQHFDSALFLPRLAGTLFGIFGIIGLLLAGVGLYGVMNYSVSRRKREIGIRLAVGAESGGIQRLIIGQGMLLVSIAIGIGSSVAWMASKVSASFLYGVQPHDALTFTLVPIFLAAVALFACWIPSRRAAGIEPLEALRYE